ncbi:MAG: hypothetical protein HN368_00975 [Spirochaetales bacterium]|nr:hypothetical protein [Spirochaetales bacterium]
MKRKTLAIVGAATLIVLAAATAGGLAFAKSRRMSHLKIGIVTPQFSDESLLQLIEATLLTEGPELFTEIKTNVRTTRIESLAGDWDVLIAAAGALAGVPADAPVDRGEYIAIDPYVLITNKKAGNAPTAVPGANISELTAWLENLDTAVWTPFVIAGDEKTHFASFLLYLAGELVEESSYNDLLSFLSDSDSLVDEDILNSYLLLLNPVIDLLQSWKSKGILVFNWTDWDNIAVQQRILDGNAAVTFSKRSYYKLLVWTDRVDLTVQRLPTGDNRRNYRMLGDALLLSKGDGRRSEGFGPIRELLTTSVFQLPIEEATSWTPVILAGPPLNINHRDIVGWFTNASDYLVFDPGQLEHELFERLHFQLR